MPPLTNKELRLFETFLQYGDLKRGKYIFVGLEEGFGGANVNTVIADRKRLKSSWIFRKFRKYVNHFTSCRGWYINDSGCLNPNGAIAGQNLTMSFHARFLWLMEPHNGLIIGNNVHKPGSNSAMIDYFPLPKLGVNNFPYSSKKFTAMNDYYNFYRKCNAKQNIRFKIFKKIYNKYPMNVSLVYAGIQRFHFKLQDVYEALGFVFDAIQYTNVVNPNYIGPISPSNVGKPFRIGRRRIKGGHMQLAILTPFLGNGRFSYNDLDVVSTYPSGEMRIVIS